MIALPNSNELRDLAYEMLDGHGDAQLGEWVEDRQKAFHLRRRLNAKEEERVGPAIDCRTTEEGQQRYDAIKHILPPQVLYLVREEIPGVHL